MNKGDLNHLVNQDEGIQDMEWHYFLPTADDDLKNPFFPKDPVKLLEEGDFNKVPVLLGEASFQF